MEVSLASPPNLQHISLKLLVTLIVNLLVVNKKTICSQFIFNILYTYINLLSATFTVLVLLVCKCGKLLNTSRNKKSK